MFSSIIKNLSILKKFLFINLLIFIFIGTLTIIYLNYVQPNLIKKKTSLQIEVINNTINNLNRLNIEFEKNEVKKFLLSTRFLFQNLDRVIFFNKSFEILADTDTLDLDPRSFSSRIEIVEFDLQNNQDKEKTTEELIDTKKKGEFENTYKKTKTIARLRVVPPECCAGLLRLHVVLDGREHVLEAQGLGCVSGHQKHSCGIICLCIFYM